MEDEAEVDTPLAIKPGGGATKDGEKFYTHTSLLHASKQSGLQKSVMSTELKNGAVPFRDGFGPRANPFCSSYGKLLPPHHAGST